MWHPIATLSYSGFLLSPMTTNLAIRWLGGREFIHPEHTAFFKGYWFATFLNLVAALLAYVLIEAPITRLVRYT